jgi:hypothetical protein
MTSGYSFVSVHIIVYLMPSEVTSAFPHTPVLGLHLFIYYCICNFIKHSKHFLFADSIKIAHSIISVTDSTLPQSYIDSLHGRCAVDLILTKLKSEVQCSLRIVLISQNVGTHMYFDLPFFLSKNMPHLPAVTLWLLMPVGWNTSNRSLQLYASVDFFHHILYSYIHIYILAFKVTYFIIQEASPWEPF